MRRFPVIAALAGAALIGPVPAHAAEPNLVANGSFEQARYSDHATVGGWSCEPGTSQFGPAHTGARSLSGTPTESSQARCTQTVPVQPGATYTLTAWVRGGYAFLGHDQGMAWAPPGTGWTQLSTSFTATGDTARIYLHGWYAQAPYQADDVVLSGPDSAVRAPVAPEGPIPDETTSHSVRLSWIGSPGAGSYRIYRDGTLLRTASGTSEVVDGLVPGTGYEFRISAVNRAGQSALTAPVSVNTAAAQAQAPPPTRMLVATPHAYDVWLAWEAVQPATDGYRIYRDGQPVGWSYGPAFTATGLRPGTSYTFEVTALNSAGESVRSAPVRAMTWQLPLT
ncbi:carbohydrate binding domain-containing protein [Catellatospora sp. KI3]|uniref:fibronectin type III domain-containing protein n=1 Tax=Catellatospora sp. KI3 TaxID=3041620 RepID=UPI002482B080|nr:carbohydrate binding domain-containing protein [Catellatospora sp. KI3]MDI1463497.1 carbohydrate binding domain-containing protein [Catellatospora sp. KI3]